MEHPLFKAGGACCKAGVERELYSSPITDSNLIQVYFYTCYRIIVSPLHKALWMNSWTDCLAVRTIHLRNRSTDLVEIWYWVNFMLVRLGSLWTLLCIKSESKCVKLWSFKHDSAKLELWNPVFRVLFLCDFAYSVDVMFIKCTAAAEMITLHTVMIKYLSFCVLKCTPRRFQNIVKYNLWIYTY